MATRTSVGDGFWDVAGTWNTGVPIAGVDDAIVRHTVTIRGDVDVGTGAGNAIVIDAALGRLRWIAAPAGNYTLNLRGGVAISNGGTFEIGNETERIPAANTATVTFATATRKIYINASGTFKAYGAENYHTASTLQRTTLNTDITGGLGIQAFSTVDPVDWDAGSVVWVGVGGNKAHAPGTIEQVTIVAKVDASNYTANFAQNHWIGDFLVLGDRNVILQSTTGNGFSIYASDSSVTLNTVRILIDWAMLLYAGSGSAYNTAGVGWLSTPAVGVANRPAGYFGIANSLFAYPTGGNINFAQIAMSFYRGQLDSETAFHDNHFYGFTQCHYGLDSQPGIWNFKDCTCIGSGYFVQNGYYQMVVSADSLWYCGAGQAVTSAIVFYGPHPPLSVQDFKITNHYGAYYPAGAGYTTEYYRNHISTWKNGYFYYGAGAGANGDIFIGSLQYEWLFDTIESYNMKYQAIEFSQSRSNVIFRNCSFDNCNTGSVGAGLGAIRLYHITFGTIYLDTCTFGTQTVNNYANIVLGDSVNAFTDWAGERVLNDNCTFKRPNNWAWASAVPTFFTDVLSYAVQDALRGLNDWKRRCMWARQFSVEFVDCHIQNAAGVDRWNATYPNVTRLGIVAGGGEIRNETTVVIDSSLALALLPFSTVSRADMTKKVPMYIPVNSGQTITIKCSLRKTQSQATGRRPMIHMFGAGIDTYSEMTDVNGIWEEQTVTGVATKTDAVNVWISCINEYDGACAYQPDSWHSPHVLGWLTVYADKFSVVIT